MKKIKLKLWIIKHKYFIGFMFVFIFPLIIGGIYALPFPQVIAIESGDLITYYGTLFGIIGSFLIYYFESQKKKKERTNDIKPQFILKVNKYDEMFKINIVNKSKNVISYLYLYDEFITATLKKECSLIASYNKTVEDSKKIKDNGSFNVNFYYNFSEPDILDKDGFPKYVSLLCDDIDGNTWRCCYIKINDSGEIYYYPNDFEMM